MDDPANRLAATKKRGRPSTDDLAARGEPVPLEPAAPEDGRLPPVQPMRCLLCGRGQTPKVVRTEGMVRTVACGLCARHMRIIYGPNQLPLVSKV